MGLDKRKNVFDDDSDFSDDDYDNKKLQVGSMGDQNGSDLFKKEVEPSWANNGSINDLSEDSDKDKSPTLPV